MSTMQTIVAVVALVLLAGCAYSQSVLPAPGICGVTTFKPKRNDYRIVNGEAVIPHSRPYQLLLVGFHPNKTAKYYCGGSLITPQHVLTAAHCVVGNAAEDIRIYAGLHNFTSDAFNADSGIAAQQFIAHKSYSSSTLTSDVAVIRLKIPLLVDNIKIGLVCVAGSNTESCSLGNNVVASGWGSTTGDPNRPSSSRPVELQQVALQCVDGTNPDCRKLTYTLSIIKDNSKLCAYAENKGVCFGDSGGPLVREKTLSDGTVYYEQVGIMSGTIDCSFTKPAPDIYADVRYLSGWISDQVNAMS